MHTDPYLPEETAPRRFAGSEPPTFEVRISVAATPEGVRQALRMLLSALSPLTLHPEEVSSIELVLAEAMNNIVEHAYGGSGLGAITLLARTDGRGIRFALEDDGHAMPNGAPPLGAHADLPREIDALPEGGFGWFLIRDLARELVYRRVQGRNHLAFRINVGAGQRAN